ncbi:DUF6682 family protein [Acinetobacter sp. CFCC 10889]|uniref:phage adaptor protein n=1 Tax=Acinetobacter sp. CFCC 10889 TaxID=1775557 RepID=UPI000DD05607|nr:DUF6682 family protein [Acinetobacter sp. CFCC 10889]
MPAVTSTTYNRLFNDARLTQLGDADGVTWSIAAMIVAYNQAKNMLMGLRPDAFTKVSQISLIQGSRQFLPDDGLRLFSVVRNIQSNGSIGRAIRQVAISDLDAMSPDWHAITGTTVYEYMFDERSPKHFYVYPVPPSENTVKVEIEYSAMPPDISKDDMDDFLPFDSIYDQPLIELMLYKLLSGDNQQGRNNTEHMQAALGLLGLQQEKAKTNNPANREV